MAKLTIKDEHGKERLHELIDDITTIGRASSNTIQITDEKGSRQHFRIEKQGSNFNVVDLGSTNGTKINGVRISTNIVLHVGDQLSVGKTTFTYEDEPQKKPESQKLERGAEPLEAGETVAMDSVETSEMKMPAPATTEESPQYVLKMLEGKTPGKVYELGIEALTIGRHGSNTIQIIDDAASNYHAEIGREPIGYVLTDLGSTNGTRVKLKNKTEFEKVVKTPLSVGMQIRVGKTLLEFDNFGKPVEDEALFGTVALDPQQLEQVLAPPRNSSLQRGLAAVIALLCVVAFAGIVYKFEKKRPTDQSLGPPALPAIDTTIGIPNGDFEQGADDLGNPRNFQVIRTPSVKPPGVTQEAQYRPEKGHLGLQISKSGAKSASTTTIVEMQDPIAIETSKTYEFSGAMKNDGDGLFGLRVTWMQGERTFTECPVVLINTQQWKEPKALLTPPLWAQRMKLSVFAQGTEGIAFFDDLSVKAASVQPVRLPPVSNGGVILTFEGTKGCFSIASNGQNIVDGGTLMLMNASGDDPWSDLSTALVAPIAAEGEKISYGGMMFDLVAQLPRSYLLEAQPGASGVDLASSVGGGVENGSRTLLRFYIVGEAAKGDILAPERILANENKTIQGAREILFNAGKSPQLNVSLGESCDVELKHEGKRRQVTVNFQGKSTVSFASESIEQKNAAEVLVKIIRKAMEDTQWGDAEVKTKELRDKYSESFPVAKEESNKYQKNIDDKWKDARENIERKLDSLKLAKNSNTADAAKQAVGQHMKEWIGSSHDDELKAYLREIDGLLQEGSNEQLENEAQRNLDNNIRPLTKSNVHALLDIAGARLQKDFLNPKGVYAKTKVAEKANDLMKVVTKAIEEQNAIEDAKTHLVNAADPFVKAHNWQAAIDVVEKDLLYQQYKDSLTEINKNLDEWKGKLKK